MNRPTEHHETAQSAVPGLESLLYIAKNRLDEINRYGLHESISLDIISAAEVFGRLSNRLVEHAANNILSENPPGLGCEFRDGKDAGIQPNQPNPHPLAAVFQAAVDQATQGKGKIHGGNSTDFYAQRWAGIAESCGSGFLLGQAVKKLEEARSKGTSELVVREILGAIVYAGMACLFFADSPENPAEAFGPDGLYSQIER